MHTFKDLDPEQVLDIALHKLQSAGIQLVEWGGLLHSRMNVPRIVSVGDSSPLFFSNHSLSERTFFVLQDYPFLVPDEDLQRASILLENLGLSLRTPSRVPLAAEGDMKAKGRHHLISQSATIPGLDQHLVIYPLSFAAFRPCEITEQAAQYSKVHLCSRILVPQPSAVYASLLRMMRRYPTYSSTRMVLRADVAMLIVYHLMGYTLETISDEDEEDEGRRSEAAAETIREWGVRKEWGKGRSGWKRRCLGLCVGLMRHIFLQNVELPRNVCCVHHYKM